MYNIGFAVWPDDTVVSRSSWQALLLITSTKLNFQYGIINKYTNTVDVFVGISIL